LRGESAGKQTARQALPRAGRMCLRGWCAAWDLNLEPADKRQKPPPARSDCRAAYCEERQEFGPGTRGHPQASMGIPRPPPLPRRAPLMSRHRRTVRVAPKRRHSTAWWPAISPRWSGCTRSASSADARSAARGGGGGAEAGHIRCGAVRRDGARLGSTPSLRWLGAFSRISSGTGWTPGPYPGRERRRLWADGRGESAARGGRGASLRRRADVGAPAAGRVRAARAGRTSSRCGGGAAVAVERGAPAAWWAGGGSRGATRRGVECLESLARAPRACEFLFLPR